MTNRWLLLNFDILGAVAVLVTMLLSISLMAGAGLAALCITSAMAFTSSGEFRSFLHQGFPELSTTLSSILDMSVLDW